MIKIGPNNTLKLYQGNTAEIKLHLSNYTLVDGDKVTFRVTPLWSTQEKLEKEVTEFDSDGNCTIALSEEETNLPDGVYTYTITVSNEQINDTVVYSNLTVERGCAG